MSSRPQGPPVHTAAWKHLRPTNHPHTGGDSASLDQIDRRFAWFRRLLRGIEAKYTDVFPLHWQIPHRIVLDFLAQTKSQLLEVLGCGDPELENVTILLKALQKSIMFEKEMMAQFEGEDGGRSPAPDFDDSVGSQRL